MSIEKIFVVIDPTVEQQPALERAKIAGGVTGAKLHLFLCVYQKLDAGSMSREDLKKLVLKEFQERVDKYADDARAAGHEVSTEVIWGRHWDDAVVEASARWGADIIFKCTAATSQAERMFSKTADYTLLRMSSCPVLLVREGFQWQRSKVLACVDIQTRDAAKAKLNAAIIRRAKQFGERYGVEVHLVNVYSDSLDYPDRGLLVRQSGLPNEQVHITAGAAHEVITQTASNLGVDLVLIGTMGRSGAQGFFLGNTAERILDRLPCDVMVIT